MYDAYENKNRQAGMEIQSFICNHDQKIASVTPLNRGKGLFELEYHMVCRPLFICCAESSLRLRVAISRFMFV